MDEYISIQEFATISGVEASTLRYWDEIGLFQPIKRNPDNNYRYYSLAQLTALNFVTVLSQLAFPLKTIAELRKERNPEKLLALLEKQEKQMDMEMRNLRQRYSIIHARRELINNGVRVDEKTLSVQYIEELPLILWPGNEYQEGNTFIQPLATSIMKTDEYHINLSFPVGGFYKNIKNFIKAPGLPDNFFSIDPIGTHMLRGGDYLVGYARGYYAELGDLPNRMAAYAKDHTLNLKGPVYIMYLLDEICVQDFSDYLVQCIVAVSKR